MARTRVATSRGELAAHGGAAAQTWATASGGAAVASRRIPRDLVSFFCIFIFSLHNFLSSNIYVKFFSPETFSFVSDAKKIIRVFFCLDCKNFLINFSNFVS